MHVIASHELMPDDTLCIGVHATPQLGLRLRMRGFVQQRQLLHPRVPWLREPRLANVEHLHRKSTSPHTHRIDEQLMSSERPRPTHGAPPSRRRISAQSCRAALLCDCPARKPHSCLDSACVTHACDRLYKYPVPSVLIFMLPSHTPVTCATRNANRARAPFAPFQQDTWIGKVVPKPWPPRPQPPPPTPPPPYPRPPPPAAYTLRADECAMLDGAAYVFDGGAMKRGDYERMGMEPPDVSDRLLPPRERHWMLVLPVRPWRPTVILEVGIEGTLLELRALSGGVIAHDSPGAFDDALAAEMGIRPRPSQSSLAASSASIPPHAAWADGGSSTSESSLISRVHDDPEWRRRRQLEQRRRQLRHPTASPTPPIPSARRVEYNHSVASGMGDQHAWGASGEAYRSSGEASGEAYRSSVSAMASHEILSSAGAGSPGGSPVHLRSMGARSAAEEWAVHAAVRLVSIGSLDDDDVWGDGAEADGSVDQFRANGGGDDAAPPADAMIGGTLRLAGVGVIDRVTSVRCSRLAPPRPPPRPPPCPPPPPPDPPLWWLQQRQRGEAIDTAYEVASPQEAREGTGRDEGTPRPSADAEAARQQKARLAGSVSAQQLLDAAMSPVGVGALAGTPLVLALLALLLIARRSSRRHQSAAEGRASFRRASAGRSGNVKPRAAARRSASTAAAAAAVSFSARQLAARCADRTRAGSARRGRPIRLPCAEPDYALPADAASTGAVECAGSEDGAGESAHVVPVVVVVEQHSCRGMPRAERPLFDGGGRGGGVDADGMRPSTSGTKPKPQQQHQCASGAARHAKHAEQTHHAARA